MAQLRLPDPFTTADVRAAGYSKHEMRRLIETRVWLPIRRGVYCTKARWDADAAHPTLAHVLEVKAARLILTRFTVAGGWSAAVLHDLPVPRTLPAAVTLTAGHGARICRPDLHLHVAPLPAGDLLNRLGVPCTTAARCVADIALEVADQDFADALCVIDAALHYGQASPGEVERILSRRESWPGIRMARRVLSFADRNAESPLESRSRLFLAEAGFPRPLTQVEIYDETNHFVARVDFFWPGHATVGEADGRAKYTHPSDLYREKVREDRLRELGLEVVRWDWSDIHDRIPETTHRIRATLSRGELRRHEFRGRFRTYRAGDSSS